jgi:hypothetical protein
MLKSLGWTAFGLAAGLLAAMFVDRSEDLAGDGRSTLMATAAGEHASTVGPHEYTALTRRLDELEAQVSGLAGTLDELRSLAALVEDRAPPREPSSPPLRAVARAPRDAPSTFAPGPTPPPLVPDSAVQWLVNGGFSHARADWIDHRTGELYVELLQARYDAERKGESPPPDDFVDQGLRKELGDFEYEQYLEAFGRSTKVSVFNVIANSAAERAGMRPGDRIVSYAGTRLFDVREVNRLLLDGTPGESVFVEIERDSQIFPIVVPRGPLGISGSTSFDSNSRMGIIQLE